MSKHKWHKEIEALINGKNVEYKLITWGDSMWIKMELSQLNLFQESLIKFRINEQKIEKYLFAHKRKNNEIFFTLNGIILDKYIGKIKLEQDDE